MDRALTLAWARSAFSDFNPGPSPALQGRLSVLLGRSRIIVTATNAAAVGPLTALLQLSGGRVLRMLPIKEPQQLVMLYQQGPHNGNNMGYRMHSYPIYQDYQTKTAPFSEVLCRRLFGATSFQAAAAGDRDPALVDAGLYPRGHRSGERDQIRLAAHCESRPHLF